MTDRQLLELAAKAAGIHGIEVDSGINIGSNAVPIIWNPLTDDGDALRLAVKLNMIVDCTTFSAMDGKKSGRGVHDWHSADELLGDDDVGNDAAIRLAIVRAAAEIGRSMP